MNEIIDTPVKRKYSNGNVFPPNGVFTAYILLVFGFFTLVTNVWFIGLILIPLASFVSFTTYGVQFAEDGKQFSELTHYFGFITISKIYPSERWTYITVLPSKSTNTMFSRATNYTNQTDYFYMICLLNQRYSHKKELIKISTKSDSKTIANGLAHLMQLEYFEYDAEVIRRAYRSKL
ncbi:MAG: hypothetical protein ACOVO3_06005 [Fluviicola sp.]|jgi:hypothetical protein